MTSRVRCSCGRVYDPVKHSVCPDCGAESAVESVVVAEKIKPPVPPKIEQAAKGPDRAVAGTSIPALLNTRLIYIAGAVVVGLSVLWLSTHRKPRGDTSAGNTNVAAVSPAPSAQPSESVHQQSAPAPSAQIQPTAQPAVADVSPTQAPKPDLAPAPPGVQLDSRLTGTWETKGRWPPNSSHMRTFRWSVETNGRFTFSGPWSDQGTITAWNGKMKWFSDHAEPADLTYEFMGDMLVTHGPLGDAYWTRSKSSTQRSSRSTQRDKSRTNRAQDGDVIRREILRRMFRHFP